jgi:hypothetical protein
MAVSRRLSKKDLQLFGYRWLRLGGAVTPWTAARFESALDISASAPGKLYRPLLRSGIINHLRRHALFLWLVFQGLARLSPFGEEYCAKPTV